MNKESLTEKLLDLVEGRETPETWQNWWDEHEPELEALLDETENEYCAELSDDDLAQVSAAGEAKRIKRRGTDGDGAV